MTGIPRTRLKAGMLMEQARGTLPYPSTWAMATSSDEATIPVPT
jgi:hypothetical protein